MELVWKHSTCALVSTKANEKEQTRNPGSITSSELMMVPMKGLAPDIAREQLEDTDRTASGIMIGSGPRLVGQGRLHIFSVETLVCRQKYQS